MRSIWVRATLKRRCRAIYRDYRIASAVERKRRTVLMLDNVCGTYVHGVFDKEEVR